MKTANQIIDDTLNRVTELIWWNRGLSKLNVEKFFKNYEDFVKNKLIERQGIYIEYIKPPIRDEISFLERAKELNLEQATINSIVKVFAKDDFQLYKHQAEAIEKIINQNKDLVLSVPTATGKTEAFFIPIIDYCVKNVDNHGLKAIILYPTKTLEVDQFNRFIKYLYYVNKNLDSGSTVRISIWDGDTPSTVGDPQFDDSAVEVGTPLRGILCPICESKLVLNRGGILACEGKDGQTGHGEFYFINAVRDRIINTSTDILVTNPEALDYLITNPDEDKFTILGSRNSEFPCKYIVYDEGHIWVGLSGTSISLLSKRLKYFYQKHNPQFIIVSATIANPRKLGQDLLDIDDEKAINVVEYYGRSPPRIESTALLDFSKWKYCTFSELIYILILIDYFSDSIDDLKEEEGNVSNVIHNLIQLKLINREGDNLKITPNGRNLLDYILKLVIFHKKEDLSFDLISSKLSDSIEFSNILSELFLNEMKEIYKIIEFFEAEKSKPINFKNLDVLINNLISISHDSLTRKEWKDLIEMYLSFGQFANILINRYHFFIKSPDNIFWCPKCKNLTLNLTCFNCNIETFSLRFCRTCHHPYLGFRETDHNKKIFMEVSDYYRELINRENRIVENIEKVEIDKENEFSAIEDYDMESLESDEMDMEMADYVYEPIGYNIYSNYCPNCNRYMPENQLYTGGVYFSTFISFILTALPRLNNSNKVLVFSDSRRNAETIGSEIMDMDYNIVAGRMFVNFLKDAPNLSMPFSTNSTDDLWPKIRQELTNEYYKFLMDKIKDRRGKQIMRDFHIEKIYKLSFLSNHRHLFLDSILIVKELYENAINTKELIIGQELFRIFTFQPSFKFQFQNYNFRQSSVYSKLIERLSKRIVFMSEHDISIILPKILKLFISLGIIKVLKNEALNDVLTTETIQVTKNLKKKNENFKDLVEDKLIKVKEFLDEQKAFLNSNLASSYETGILTRPSDRGDFFKANYHLKLLETVYFCKRCYSVFPFRFNDLNKCPVCHNELNVINRLETSGTKLFFKSIPGNLYNIDHWGEEFLKYGIDDSFKENIIKIGIHRAGLPYSIRGAIEESFRKGEINVVSATPTMELGIDIGKLNCALQLGIPPSLANYIQRCGRTGRSLSGTSLVFTVIRNQHAIDEYYFVKLDEFFNKLDEISIPHHKSNKFIYAGHILTYILSYLARNPSTEGTFLNIYALKDKYDDAGSFVNKILHTIGRLINLLEERKDEILKKINDCFGPSSIEIFEELISDEGELSLWKKSSDFFTRIEGFSGGYGIQNLSEMYHNITAWTNLIGFVANYRGFGENIPISIETDKKTTEVDTPEVSRVIRENFPGEKSKNGAIFRLSGARYVVDKVWGSGQIGDVKLCPNTEGDHPYIVIKTSENDCPFCGTTLVQKPVYKIKKIIAKRARGLAYNYKTYPYLSGAVIDTTKKECLTTTTILNLQINLFKGRFNHLEFTAAFNKKYKYQRNFVLIPSEAKVEDQPLSVKTITSRKEFLESISVTEKFAPIGNKVEKAGISFNFSFDIFKKGDNLIKSPIPFLVSFTQALKRAISIIGDCELEDFDLFWNFEEDKISFYLLEGLGGAQGVSNSIYIDLTDTKRRKLPHLLKEFMQCSYCGEQAEYCSRCLLLKRTPEFYLRNNLLGKTYLKNLLL